jgi:hypothetical protein
MSRRSLWFCLLGLSIFGGCDGVPDPALVKLGEARRLAADVHVQFVKAADASDRAVLADTDEASVAFAHDAEGALAAVAADEGELGPRLRALGYQEEAQALDDFSKRFAEYRKVDRDVLELAVENTNLKAQRLSFGPVRDAADALRNALDSVTKAASPKDRCRAESLATRAVLAVREIQVLQAPHIAEADDAAMTRLETEMATRAGAARDALAGLSGLVQPSAKLAFGFASTQFDKFESLSAELVALSRRNTNVRSLSLSLRQKPALMAACEASLVALEGALAKKGFTATR